MRKLTAAIVGAGFIGPVHVEGLLRAGVDVVGILGSSAEKSRIAAEKLGLVKGYANFNAVLNDPAVDVVHLATPNRLHFEQAAAVLRAGKHVMCEKPLAMTTRESAELVRLAGESSLAAGVAYVMRFHPLCFEAKARVARGDVGRLLHVTGSYSQDWLLKETDFNWRVQAGEGGELRAVADIGAHWFDLAQFITGQNITALCADLFTAHPTRQSFTGSVETFSGQPGSGQSGSGQPGSGQSGSGQSGSGQSGSTRASPSAAAQAVPITTDDFGALLLRFDGGARGCMWVSQVTAGRKNCLQFEIAGASRSLAWNSERPNELWIGQRDAANQSLLRDPALLSEPARAIANYPGGHNEGHPDAFKQLFKAFYGYIAGGDFSRPATFPTFLDGHREVVLCEAVLLSHRQRRWIEIEEIAP